MLPLLEQGSATYGSLIKRENEIFKLRYMGVEDGVLA